MTTTVTAPNSKTTTTLNLSGLVESSKDITNNSVTYTYNSLGKPETVTSNDIITHIRYDDRGFQRVLKDANLADSVKYVYDAYGQLTSQTNARGQITTFRYDAAGRIEVDSCSGRKLTYQYVPSGNGIGQIQTIKQNNNTIRSYTYTPLGQLSSVAEKIDNTDYTTSYSYNGHGQLTEQQSPSGLRVSYQYNSAGLLTSMRNAENDASLWQLNAANALGQVTESTLGNGLKRISGYDAYYLPNKITLRNGTSVIDSVIYAFNNKTGNLTIRNDISNSRNETFGYDVLNRLDSLRLNNGTLNRVLYHPNGNINTKFDVGTYEYNNNNHAVSGITNQVSTYNPPTFNIENTSYNRVSSLTQGGSIIKKLNFQYNADKQRNKSLYYENNVLKKTMYYVGNYEKEVIEGGSTKEYDYICTPEGLSAIAVKTNGTRSFYYVQTDHLGSIRVVTTATKAIQTRYDYDAWGKQTSTGTSITNRGYIGQEHINDFGLLNFNARLYDPVLGRFMGVDPYVQMPDFTQSYNRYSYALNNPLIYTDPDGEFWQFLFALAWAYGKGVNDNNGQWNPAKWNSAVVVNVGYNTGGNWTFSGGVGSPNGSIPMFGYNTQYGWGAGLNNNGSSSMYYPGYENRINNAIGQNVSNSVNNLRQNYFYDENVKTEWNSYVSAGMTVGSEVFYSRDFGTWMGKDFRFRTIYGRAGNGNQYTGGKYKFGKNVSNKFKWGGNIIGAYNVYKLYDEYNSGNINDTQLVLEETSNAYSTLGGLYGVAWGVGWETGRLVTQQTWYQRAKFNFYYNYWERHVGPPSPVNIAKWEYFYNNYKP